MKLTFTLVLTTATVFAVILTIAALLYFTPGSNIEPQNYVQEYSYSVVQTYPHDTKAFTEGLVYSNGVIYESTGLYGESSLRKVDLVSGKILQESQLGTAYFGEGTTIVEGKIIQLTWQEHKAFIYDKTSFQLLGNFTYLTEGWGLTFDGEKLIMSDGSDTLSFLDPLSFQKTGQIHVREGNTSIFNLNELEYVNGSIYANIFLDQKIAVINPETGQIRAWINLTGIQDLTGFSSEMVLNGIAYDAQNDRLFVTGKDWPALFEIKLILKK